VIKQFLSHIFGYFLVGFVWLLSRLPLRALYPLSSLLAFVMADVVAYRRKVVRQNLRRSFPQQPEKEIRRIARGFYRHLAEVMVETIKLLHIPDREIRHRSIIEPEADKLLRTLSAEKRSFICLMGHFGNWEWIPPTVYLNHSFEITPAYRPLRNKVIDRLMLKIRGQYTHALVPKKQVARFLVRFSRQEAPGILGLIADQTPAPGAAYWTEFLHQDTPVFSGPEKLARTFGMPVVFAALRREQRGRYRLHIQLLTNRPQDLPEGELSKLFMKKLEAEILRAPAHWLWSHRRWKHGKDVGKR